MRVWESGNDWLDARVMALTGAGPAVASAPLDGFDAKAIAVRNLRKSYGSFEAVRDISFHVDKGEIVAFLGPNGAGKTTTVEIMEGFRTRDGGDVSVLGLDPQTAPLAWRDKIGVVLQDSEVEPDLTARECVELYAGYHFHPRDVMETIELVGLRAKADTKGSELSGGQRRRLDVALGLVGDPELLFLDEPTTGFDPSARRQTWDVIDGLRSLGKTIFLTTHYMDEAERLADRIIVIARGTIVAEGRAATLAGRNTRPARVIFGLNRDIETSILEDRPFPFAPTPDDGKLCFSSTSAARDVVRLDSWADSKGLEIRDLEVRPPTLEDIYLELTTERKETP